MFTEVLAVSWGQEKTPEPKWFANVKSHSSVNGARGVSRIWYLENGWRPAHQYLPTCPYGAEVPHFPLHTLYADNARPFPWSRKSHIFWFWPLCFAAVRVSSHTGNYGCGESSRVRAAQGVFDQPVPRLWIIITFNGNKRCWSSTWSLPLILMKWGAHDVAAS